jgi:proteasome lid subunit RPN8/RPN11
MLLSHAIWQEIQAHALACLPEEACGLLGGALGADGTARAVLAMPVENILHSPVRFRMEPLAQLRAMQAIEAAGLDLLAIFHSHPNGPQKPSPTDLAEFAYPGVLSLILFPMLNSSLLASGTPVSSPPAWRARAFDIQGAFFPGAHSTPSFSEVTLLFAPAVE